MADELETAQVPQRLARELAMLSTLVLIPDIAQIAQLTGVDLRRTAEQYFKVTELFRLGRIEAAASRIDAGDHYTALALSRNLEEIPVARRMITTAAVASATGSDDPVAAWIERDKLRVERVRGGRRAQLLERDVRHGVAHDHALPRAARARACV